MRNKIARKYMKLNAKIDDLRRQITELQFDCPHTNCVYSNHGSSLSRHGSSGHWDQNEYFWVNFRCLDCEKQWSKEQSFGLVPDHYIQVENAVNAVVEQVNGHSYVMAGDMYHTKEPRFLNNK